MADKLLVTAQWDDEASVWVATSDDIQPDQQSHLHP